MAGCSACTFTRIVVEHSSAVQCFVREYNAKMQTMQCGWRVAGRVYCVDWFARGASSSSGDGKLLKRKLALADKLLATYNTYSILHIQIYTRHYDIQHKFHVVFDTVCVCVRGCAPMVGVVYIACNSMHMPAHTLTARTSHITRPAL